MDMKILYSNIRSPLAFSNSGDKRYLEKRRKKKATIIGNTASYPLRWHVTDVPTQTVDNIISSRVDNILLVLLQTLTSLLSYCS
ncbi:hypothetical protein J6590_098825 [Homalodisca vitripennis]|nr:hypothetical protein J6590_098825 [Homalodisca vitripennis]